MKKNKKKTFQNYIIGAQVAITVFCGVFLGYQLDLLFATEQNYLTFLCSALTIIHVLYRLTKRFQKRK